jgi:hypothetical protein
LFARTHEPRLGGMSATVERSILSDERLTELLALMQGADSAELKLTVPEASHRSAIAALGLDPLDAQIRQVFFFDTPDLALNRAGVVARARRVQRKGGDSVVKLRPVVPDDLAPELRRTPGFFAEHAPEGVTLDDLSVLGPIFVLKLKSTGERGRRRVTEMWLYPDGSRIFELSTKCATNEAFQVAAEGRAMLVSRGVDLSGEQHTKTHKALELFSAELQGATGAA